jgi:nucleotide-binding universal stress UspA family protein
VDQARIVLGLESSEGAATAAQWCAGLASALDAEVIVVHALHTDEALPSDDQFNQWCGPLEAAGVPVRRLVEDEAPDRLLTRVAEAENADLIVIGAPRRGALAGFVLGTVVEDLVYHGRRPVVVVPTQAPEG